MRELRTKGRRPGSLKFKTKYDCGDVEGGCNPLRRIHGRARSRMVEKPYWVGDKMRRGVKWVPIGTCDGVGLVIGQIKS